MVNLNIILTVIIISIILIILILLTLNYFNKIENFREINGKYGYICSYNTDCTPVENTMLCVKEGYNIYSCGDIKVTGLTLTRNIPSVVPIYNEMDISNINITYIKANSTSTRIFTDDGKLFITGRDYGLTENKFTEPLLSLNIKKLCDVGQDADANPAHSSIFFIGKDDNLYCYGYNGYGQLGLGDRITRNTPTKIPPPSFDNKKIKDVYGSYYGRLFLTEDGVVYASGLNSYKKLGGLTLSQMLSPELIPQSSFDNKKIKHINTADYFSFFLTEDGDVYACGLNTRGQFGLGDTSHRYVPTLIPPSSFGNKKIKDVSCCDSYTAMFLTEDGDVYACGPNNYGQLGLGDTTNRYVPTLIDVSDIKQITCTTQYTLLLDNDGILYSTGSETGALGIVGNRSHYFQECTTIAKPVKQISSSKATNVAYVHSMILTEDGEIYTFGYNSNGQLGLGNNNNYYTRELASPLSVKTYNVPIIRDISTDSETFLYTTSDGIVYGNGLNSSGQIGLGDKARRIRPEPINYTLNYIYTLSNIKQVSCGHHLSAILTEDGFVYTCGNNSTGQLGTNEFLKNSVELNFMQILRSDVKKISCGVNNLLILTNNGDVYACGQNNYGQLGLGDTTYRLIPTLIPNFSKIIDIHTSRYYHTLFLTEDGDVYACGLNNYGQLGIGNTTNMNTPTEVTSAFAIKKIFAGYGSSFFIDDVGDVYACGQNNYGQLGLGHTTQKNVPDKVLLNNVTTISCGTNFNVFIDDDGRTYSCGIGGYIGFADRTSRSTPTRISLNGVKEISSSSISTYFLKTNGTVYTYDVGTQPKEISGLSNVKTLSAGHSHSIIVKEDDSVHSIGSNSYGELGLGDSTSRSEYNQVSVFKTMGEFNNIKRAKVAVRESLFLKEDGSVYITIDRIPQPMISLVDIKIQDMCVARYSSSQSSKFFLTEDGYVYSMGINYQGMLGLGDSAARSVPTRIDYDISGNDFNNIKKISCGRTSCIFLKTDGSVYSTGSGATGLNSTAYFPTSIPFLSDIEDIEMSDSSGHALFLKKNGDVYGCGSNGYGQLGGASSIAPIKLNLMNIVSLSCGFGHSVFVTKDGDVYACGYNNNGQLGLGDTTNRATPSLIGSISDVKKVHAEASLSYLLKTAEA